MKLLPLLVISSLLAAAATLLAADPADIRVEREVFPSIAEVIHDQTGLGEPESQDVIYARYETQL